MQHTPQTALQKTKRKICATHMPPKLSVLARQTIRDWFLFSPNRNGVNPQRHIQEAVNWILHANEMTEDGGISKGYSLITDSWAPSYPETSGYTVPTLLDYAQITGNDTYRIKALAVADYLVDLQLPDGGIPYWDMSNGQMHPVVFDTGQVLFGWIKAYAVTSDERYKSAAYKAANWLADCQDDDGAWRKYQHLNQVKTIDTRVALALVKAYRQFGEESFLQSAERNLDWAITQQQENGWFKNCAFRVDEDPFTHTLAYTAEGLLESGVILKSARYIAAGKRTGDAFLNIQRKDGALYSTYDQDWSPTSRSSCLTGNCQIAGIWLRLFEHSREERYLHAAQRALNFVAATQELTTSDPNIRGAIAGSYPIHGRYERFKYPNWAAKFFVDAMLFLSQIEAQR